jgi:hypothetical protein
MRERLLEFPTPRERVKVCWKALQIYVTWPDHHVPVRDFDSAFELLCWLAVTLRDAGLAPRVSALGGTDIGGRALAVPLLQRAVTIAEQHPNQFRADKQLKRLLGAVMDTKSPDRCYARTTLAFDLYDEMLADHPLVGGAGVGDADEEGHCQYAGPARQPKKSTNRGDARVKLIANLSEHHKYDSGSVGNPEPIGNNELARTAEVGTGTASAFFTEEFGGHDQYRALCRESGALAAALKLLNGEFSPKILYGRQPPNEGHCDDGD